MDSLIICTRNRPLDLRQCLLALMACNDLVGRIIVVDSSDSDASARVCEDSQADFHTAGTILQYVTSAPGLTHQRNQGLKALGESDGVTFFVDDDCRPQSGFFSEVLSTFDDHADAVGVGAVIHHGCRRYSDSPRRDWKGIVRTVFLLSPGPGRVNRAGCQGGVNEIPPEARRVEWLSGGAMAFRSALLRREEFDESGLTGYSAGEDLDISLRMAEHGALYVAPRTAMLHEESTGERPPMRERVSRGLVNQHYIVTKHSKRLSRSAFWWSLMGRAFIALSVRDSETWRGVSGAARVLVSQSARPAHVRPGEPTSTPLDKGVADDARK